MIPILYAKNAAEFNSNGKGVLADVISCQATEERNGAFTLQMQYPISGKLYGEIGEGSVIKAKPNETSDPQLFRIYKSSKPMKGIVTFYANHISYDLSGLPLMELSLTASTAQAAMTAGFAACPISHNFTAWSDKTVLEDIKITAPRSLRSFIGGQEGSILSKYAGELEFDNFVVKLHVNRGADNGVTINYGKNLTDAKQERNIEAVYTHVCPFATKTVNVYDEQGEIIDQHEETVTLMESVIALVDPGNIGHSKALILDLTDEFEDGEEITEAAVRAKAEAYIATHELNAPEINITVSLLQIWDTPEYKDFAALERVRLCDTVTVRFDALGISAKAKIIKTVYDVLNERYTTLTIGSARYSLSDTVKQINEKIDASAEAVKENKNKDYADLNNAIIEATNRITGNAGGYVVLHPANYPSEILIMNTNSIQTATKVWRWNSSGLGYSSSGYDGPYGLAMTIDGSIVADYIKTGTLSAITVSGCTITGGSLNIGSGKFEVDSAGNIHAEGYIKATSGEIGGCTIVNGVLQVPAANITGRLVASQIDATNLNVAAANITGILQASQLDVNGIIATGNISVKSSTIANVAVYYALNTSSTTAPSTGWSTTAPAWEDGKYMWQKTIWTYASGSTSESAPTCISGAKGETGTSVTILGSYATLADLIAAHPTGNPGDAYLVNGDLYVWNGSSWENVGRIKGDTGDPGTGITAITQEYYLSDSNVTTSGGSWSTGVPVWVPNKYIWIRSKIDWSNGSTSYTTEQVENAINGANEAANAARLAVLDIEGNVYYSGTTEIDGGKIRTGSVTALQINATNLHVSAANIDGQLTASQINAAGLHIDASNVDNRLTYSQLPTDTAKTGDIPTNNNQLINGAGYQTETGVVDIIDGRITADYIEALSISVGAAQITGKLTAGQINADGIVATGVDITGTIKATAGEIKNLTISGRLKFGGNNSYYIDPNYNDSSYYINLPGFRVDDASGAVFSGKLNAPSGNIGGCSIVNGVLQVPVANIVGTITATALEVKSGSYTYFKAGDGAVQIAGFNADNNSLYSGSSFANSTVFLCTGSTGYMTIGGHYGTSWGLKVGSKFGVNTSGELYCTSANLTGAIYATTGTIGNETYNFTIGASGTSASLYCGTSSLAKTGGLGSSSNQVYIGTDGVSLQIENTNYNYTSVIRSGVIMTYGDTNGSGNYNRAIAVLTDGIRFYNLGSTKVGNTSNIGNYKIAEINLGTTQQYALLDGTWKSTNSIAVISDRNAKNSIESVDARYIDLIDRLRPVRYKYNNEGAGRYHTGFIAQEVKEAMEAAGLTEQEFATLCYDNIGQEGESWSLRYEELIAPMIAKIKALEARISALEA